MRETEGNKAGLPASESTMKGKAIKREMHKDNQRSKPQRGRWCLRFRGMNHIKAMCQRAATENCTNLRAASAQFGACESHPNIRHQQLLAGETHTKPTCIELISVHALLKVENIQHSAKRTMQKSTGSVESRRQITRGSEHSANSTKQKTRGSKHSTQRCRLLGSPR